MGSVEVDISTREKYSAERAKRLATTNFAKRLEVSKDPSVRDLLQDPWADYDARAKEAPYLENGSRTKFLIVGAGHSGLIHAYHLIKAGFDPKDLVIVDNAGGWGGTWYWNRYPGLQCDVEGYCYLPLLQESGFVPQNRYSHGEEIRQNAEHIAAKFGLQGMFCTSLVVADWNESDGRWDVTLRRQLGPAHEELNVPFTVSTQFLITATGPLSSMSIPALPGLDDFRREKKVFHAARWDYDYTGGSTTDPHMVNLRDKVVGIVGTAATAVQAVPELAKWAQHLYVF
ncbi:phenylacetone monooxygenase [Apiospora aurea]|uniref:Phenylacetone monooxygenase n=1 Tax=Apiospora aurea TaxID=335848 RepID=A0ABR1QZ68_9PEZI